jgi:5-formyltetrahydrofolate cyclo-ligase
MDHPVQDAATAGFDLAAWRAAERSRLIALRAALPEAERRAQDERITACVVDLLLPLEIGVLGGYWPMQGEFDPRVAMLRLREAGTRIALPVVERKASPLAYVEWAPGVETRPGVFGLPVPQGMPHRLPDAVFMPPVGFDAHGFRLGYGGGYFDRTLAALDPQPLKIGVAREASRIPTIHPQAHDIPMDVVVTELGVFAVEPGGLRLVGAREARQLAARIRLPGAPRPTPGP